MRVRLTEYSSCMLQVFQPQLPIALVHTQQDDRLSGPSPVPLPAKEVSLGSFLCPATRSQSSGSRSTQGLYMSPDVTSVLHVDSGAATQDVRFLALSSAAPALAFNHSSSQSLILEFLSLSLDQINVPVLSAVLIKQPCHLVIYWVLDCLEAEHLMACNTLL